ncbi:MlaA family lipoprotein [Azohydromonas caseinilytica]|uniref:VacJ family lipoprotein n=1 Tax=Azohydromonas caseinilytica TaxID=2728836 RepID=A0A848F4Z7_9BURK|nr:VacJ family lipoprotein [Azohydromonas caseinilytica]NML13443.1 VacJ family lipoprotein [Azohydromonas caseinilytica]
MKHAPLLLAAALLSSGGAQAQSQSQTSRDPLERINRPIFSFNEAVDRTVLVPVATAYRDVVPSPVRTGVGNFIGNFADAWSAVNQFLQGKAHEGVHMSMRVIVNTFFGLGGVLDWGTEMGLERQSEDFGQTLGRWGLGAGPYLVLPFLGPSSVRDTAGLTLDLQTTPSAVLFGPTRDVAAATAVQVVHRRSELLQAGQLLEDVALDKYQFLRDAYLARRNSQVWDGNPPEEPEEPEDDAGTPDAPVESSAPAAPEAPTPAPIPAR